MTLTNRTNDENAAPLTSDALLELKFVSDPQLTPAGRGVVAVVTTITKATAKAAAKATGNATEKATENTAADSGADDDEQPPHYRSNLHLFKQQSGGPGDERGIEQVALTHNENKDFAPRISPGGEWLAFARQVADEKPPQLFLMPLTAAGEPRQLTDHEAGVGEYLWRPDGSGLVYVSRGEHRDDRAKKGVGRRIRRMRYRADGQGFLPDAAAELHSVTLEGSAARLTNSDDDRVFSGPSALAFSPDGRHLYFCRTNDESDHNDFRTDVMMLDLDTGATTVVVSSVLGADSLAVSPSGRRLSYTATSRQDDLASSQGAWLLDLEAGVGAGEPRLLSGELDIAPAEASDSRYGRHQNQPTWNLAGGGAERLLVNVHRYGRTGLAYLQLDGSLEPLSGPVVDSLAITAFTATAPRSSQSAAIAFLAETPLTPGELWLRSANGEEARLSTLNDDWCRRYNPLAPAGPFKVETKVGVDDPASVAQAIDDEPTDSEATDDEADAHGRPEAVEYWTLSPTTARSDDAVVLQVHGGPHTAYGNGFVFEFQLLAAKGYRVVYGNPRGSSSYGHHFATSLLGRYGSIDADDVMAIASDAVERLGVASAPLHLTGGSYGGFMTNWLLGVSDRFTSAVSQRSISNWTSMYGTSDIGPRFVEREIHGVPWDDVETLWRQSPLKNAAAVSTPLLLVHSEEDYRCPIEQAEQFFTALKRIGRCDVELLRFPGEGHELSRSGRPDRRAQRLDAIVDWFERHS